MLEADPLSDVTYISGADDSSRPPGPNPQRPMARDGRMGMAFEVPNPHVLRGEADMETTPVTFNRYGDYWGTQLRSGFIPIERNWLRLSSVYRRAGWLNYIIPIEPGKMHGGVMAGGYVPRGPAPSQVQMAFNNSAGAQPNYPGGPGQKVVGVSFSNPGTGA